MPAVATIHLSCKEGVALQVEVFAVHLCFNVCLPDPSVKLRRFGAYMKQHIVEIFLVKAGVVMMVREVIARITIADAKRKLSRIFELMFVLCKKGSIAK